MHEYRKLYTLLQMIGLLSKSLGYTVPQLARKYEASERTIYRHFVLLKECGFTFTKDSRGRHRILDADEIFKKEGINFSLEEAGIIKDALLAIHNTHPLRNMILTKLFALSELGITSELVYDKLLGENIRVISQSIKEKRQVLLKHYHSLNSGTITSRLVEPISFVQNMRYFTAYEPVKKAVRQFKPDRIGTVELLNTTFQHSEKHITNYPDAFGMTSGPEMKVELLLNARASHLLREEFPMAASALTKNEIGEDWYWSGMAKGCEGIGRFVLGLPGEIQVLAPKELIEYNQSKLLGALRVQKV